ncbi:MAG: DUF4386 domain-containing protein [Anaerolineales bacterium]|nr:MAG: DUF4386 domain-containing protein [Anaerolineales bacterium]
MNTHRRTAILVGIFFIIGTVAGVSSGVVTGPVLGGSDYLAKVAANESKIALGALLVLVMGFPLAMIPVLMFPIFRKYSEPLALGAVVFRGVLEAVTYMALAVYWLLLIPVSQEFVKAGTADALTFQAMGAFLTKAGYWTEHLLALVFTIGAMMLYWLFYKTKLVPNWLSLWGFIGAILNFVAAIFNMFDPTHPALSLGVKWGNLIIPLAIQEMVFALWVIVKGFNPDAAILEDRIVAS